MLTDKLAFPIMIAPAEISCKDVRCLLNLIARFVIYSFHQIRVSFRPRSNECITSSCRIHTQIGVGGDVILNSLSVSLREIGLEEVEERHLIENYHLKL